jgi:hypothetical protein
VSFQLLPSSSVASPVASSCCASSGSMNLILTRVSMTLSFLASQAVWLKSGMIPLFPPALLAWPGVVFSAILRLSCRSSVLAAWNACSSVGYEIPSYRSSWGWKFDRKLYLPLNWAILASVLVLVSVSLLILCSPLLCSVWHSPPLLLLCGSFSLRVNSAEREAAPSRRREQSFLGGKINLSPAPPSKCNCAA